MTQKPPKIPFSSFLYAVLVGHLVFGLPAISTIVLLNLIDIKSLFFIILLIAPISIPVSTVFSWLIAKGSNWENTSSAIVVTSLWPGKFYGFLLGGSLGLRFFGEVGALVLAVMFFLVARFAGVSLGEFLAEKIVLSQKT
ncbi:MAG: hypothetical protein GY797_25495 [Deltaproteobacteria bacterium]|nr:hypothetical protein [Deltaproteobacteria bacterium]